MKRRRHTVSLCMTGGDKWECCVALKWICECIMNMFSSLKLSNLRSKSKNHPNSGISSSQQDLSAPAVLTSKPPRTPLPSNRRSSKCKYYVSFVCFTRSTSVTHKLKCFWLQYPYFALIVWQQIYFNTVEQRWLKGHSWITGPSLWSSGNIVTSVHRCGTSGSMRACHTAGPGSIPGRDKFPGWGFFGVFPLL